MRPSRSIEPARNTRCGSDQPHIAGPFGGQSFFLTAGLPREKEDGALACLQHQLNPQHAVARMYDRSLPLTMAAYEQVTSDHWVEPFRGFRIATRFRAATEEAQALLDRHNAAALAYPLVTPDALTVTA